MTAYQFPSAHDVPEGAQLVARQRAVGPRSLRRFSARCACGWSTRKHFTYEGAWEALLVHIADGRMAEVLGEEQS